MQFCHETQIQPTWSQCLNSSTTIWKAWCWNPHQKGVTVNQMHVDISYMLSFQLCVHCLYIRALYSFQTGSVGWRVFFLFTPWLITSVWSAAFASSLSSYPNTNRSYALLNYQSLSPSTKTRCVLNSRRSQRERWVSCYCQWTSWGLWKGMTRTTASSVPSSTWPRTSL